MYVSVTGLRLKRFWHMPVFWRHATASMMDAHRAVGNLSAEARTIDGVHHTLSTWDSRSDMLTYLKSERHARAMRRFSGIAKGRVVGGDAPSRPDWDTALARYHAEGRDVYQTG